MFPDVQQMVDSDAIKPGAETGLAAEARKSADGFEQNLLGRIFSVGAAMEHANGEVEEPRKVACEKQLELLVVACHPAAHELLVSRTIGVIMKWVWRHGGAGRH
jgi:hypothetical protein